MDAPTQTPPTALTALTADLGRFIADMPAHALPAQAIDTIRRGIADTVGVAFASVGEPVLRHQNMWFLNPFVSRLGDGTGLFLSSIDRDCI